MSDEGRATPGSPSDDSIPGAVAASNSPLAATPENKYNLSMALLGDNTPTKSKRKRATTSPVWSGIRRLKGIGISTYGPPFTHACIACKQLLKVSKIQKSGTFQTTIALRHLQACPAAADLPPKVKDLLAKSKAIDEEKLDRKQTILFSVGVSKEKVDLKVVGGFIDALDALKDVAMVAQARFFIYSSQRISKRTMDDPFFVEMLESVHEAGGGKGVFARITTRALSDWILAEYLNFELYLGYMMCLCLEHSKGNPFAQGMNDCATLANGTKHMAIGLQFIDPELSQNHAVCLGMEPVGDGTSVTGKQHIENTTKSVTKQDYSVICHSTISDQAAISIAKLFDHSPDICAMHSSDKIGRSAIGDLVRSANKIPINPFKEGQRYAALCHLLGVHFSYGNRADNLKECSVLMDGPEIKIQLDLNTTRVSARNSLFHSLIRLNKGLHIYTSKYSSDKSCPAPFAESQWEVVVEMQGVLQIPCTLSTLSQTEKHHTAALAHPLKSQMMMKLRANTLSVVDRSKVTASPNLPRIDRKVSELTQVGKECLNRAKLEAERRYCGNKGETLNNASVVPNDQEMLAMMLDPRTVGSAAVLLSGTANKKTLLQLLRTQYGIYSLRAWKFDREKKEAKSDLDLALAIIVEEEPKEAELGVPAPPAPPVFQDPNTAKDEWSDSDDDMDDSDQLEDTAPTAKELEADFDQKFKAFRKHCIKIDWRNAFPQGRSLNLPAAPAQGKPFVSFGPDTLLAMWDLNVLDILKDMIKKDPNRSLFGHLPHMATSTRGSVGSLMASSYCERVNSCANLVLTDGNSCLDEKEVNMSVVLRMNKGFMKFMRSEYSGVSKAEMQRTIAAAAEANNNN